MSLRIIVPFLVASACTTSPATSIEGPTLPSDQRFTGLVAPFASPEDCLANTTTSFTCLYELELCANGRAGQRYGDLVYSGTYHLEPPHAVGSTDGGGTFDFDLDSDELVMDGGRSQAYIPDAQGRWDTLQFDSIDCEQPAP